MPEPLNLKTTVQLDPHRVFPGDRTPSFLVVDCEAPPQPARADDAPRVPLNLALVIDASGSMAGDRIAMAREAAVRVLQTLQGDDVVSVVSFADDAVVHVDRVRAGDGSLHTAIDATLAISTRGCTDLTGGWLKGAELAARTMETTPNFRNRVIVLSDGKANRGIVAPAELRVHAEQLRDRGLLTSTVGIGDDYSDVQLGVLAEHGGGRIHDAENADEIAEVLLAELSETVLTFAEDVAVSLHCPPGVKARSMGDFPERTEGADVITRLGSLVHGARRVVAYRLELPGNASAESLEFVVDTAWTVAGEDEAQRLPPRSVTLVPAWPDDDESTVRNSGVAMQAARAWQARISRDVVALNRDGDFERARSLLEGELDAFRAYCGPIREASGLLEQLESLRQIVSRPLQERLRKELRYASYRSLKGVQDSRKKRQRMEYQQLLENELHRQASQSQPSRSAAPHPSGSTPRSSRISETGSGTAVLSPSETYAFG